MNNDVNSGMRGFWNDSGGRMWVIYQHIIEVSMAPFGQKVMDILDFNDGERVLDIGCGCGGTTLEIAQLVGSNGYVFGVDISEMIIESAKNKACKENANNIIFKCVDAQTYSFVFNEFDVVFSRFGVMFFDEPVVAFQNIRKSLVAGGRMAFVCWQPIEDIEWISLPRNIVGNYITLPPLSEPNEPGGFSFGNTDRVEKILRLAGFVDIVIEKFNSKINIGADMSEAMEFMTHIGPAGSVLDNSDIDSKTQVKFTNDLYAALQEYQTKQGIELGSAMWIVTARNA